MFRIRPGIARVGPGRGIITWYDFRDGATATNGHYSQVHAQIDAIEWFLQSPADPAGGGDRNLVAFSFSVGPNPSRGATAVELTLSEARPVSIRVMHLGRPDRAGARGWIHVARGAHAPGLGWA